MACDPNGPQKDPYAAPRSDVRAPRGGLPATLEWSINAALGLKLLQLAASMWLASRDVFVVWSFLDIGLHVAAAALLRKQRRIGIVFLIFALPLGAVVSLREGTFVLARTVYLVGLPLLVLTMTLRHWSKFAIE